MAAQLWLISDTHFFHERILNFKVSEDGPFIRPGFESVEEMNECMIERWNRLVKPHDHIYHLGDVALACPNGLFQKLMLRLKGVKRLVRGNHDKFKTRQYIAAGFQEIHGMRLLDDVWLTHAPLHPSSMGKALGNAHGHIHEKRSPPGPYVNVCVEQTNYSPVPLEWVKERLLDARASWASAPPDTASLPARVIAAQMSAP